MIFFLHFVSDREKDLKRVWTRIPILYGSLFGILSMFFLFLHGGVEERLFHRTSFFRQRVDAMVFSVVLLAATCAAGLALPCLFFLGRERMGSGRVGHRVLVQLLYEMCLMIPLTVAMMGGSGTNLLNLLLIFILTMVVWGSRVRDALHFWRTFPRWNRVGLVLLLCGWMVVGVWVILAVTVVWTPAIESVFLMQTVSDAGTTTTLAVFTAQCWRFFSQDLLPEPQAKVSAPAPTPNKGVFMRWPHAPATMRKRTL